MIRRRDIESAQSGLGKKEQELKSHVTGTVERITFHSEESGFCILRVKVRALEFVDADRITRASSPVSPPCTSAVLPFGHQSCNGTI
ncbi:YrrC family ATP-dependent DNA helicase [Methylomarinovum tepidoasis]|uniref:YrrC family ATP-dependent DNA helicase n=1 Tax=Methylomarinovum tepidoasis TaxID=2840183 RepID=UPI003BF59C79